MIYHSNTVKQLPDETKKIDLSKLSTAELMKWGAGEIDKILKENIDSDSEKIRNIRRNRERAKKNGEWYSNVAALRDGLGVY